LSKSKPRIIFALDYPNWAFDYVARSIAARLSHRFKFRIEYGVYNPCITGNETDLIYVFYWRAKLPKNAGFKKDQVIKEVASWAWELSHHGLKFTKEEFAAQYLDDCEYATTPCAQIYETLRPFYPNIVHCPNGVEHGYFSSGFLGVRPKGRLKIGWVGNPNDEHKVKGLHEILIPATKGYDFIYSHGSMTRRELRKFYAGIDVLAIASKSESQPLPLLEAMSAGCFPVCTNVGIVPEIILDKNAGLVVPRSVESFVDAFSWCEQNLEMLRTRRVSQSKFASQQSWDIWAERFGDLFEAALNKQKSPDFALPSALIGAISRVGALAPKKVHPQYLRRCRCFLVDLQNASRRWFMGDRFKKAPGDAIYRRFLREIAWWIAIKRRFFEIVKEVVLLSAFAAVFKSVAKKLS
jgi:glycosyltransferase involved in cell wall biosynthesis